MSTKKEETRARLLDAARRLLVERGFHGVGLEDIAAAAGVSRQAVYKSHFASKADLLLALVRHVHVAENLDELVRPALEAKSALARFEATIGTIVRIEERLHDLAMSLSMAALSDADAAVAWRDRLEVKRGALRDAVRGLADEGRLGRGWDAEDAVDMLSALVSVDTYHRLVVERGLTPEALIHNIVELCAGSIVVERKDTMRRRKRKPRVR